MSKQPVKIEFMNKILIIGNSASGKSTLARKLAETRNLAHLDLDTIAWLTVNPPQRNPLGECQLLIDKFINSHQKWVIEGCYTDLIEIASAQANQLIFLNLSIDDCIKNAQNRQWEKHKYESKTSQDENLTMLIEWIKNYKQRDDLFSYSLPAL